jgi:hypothetical protein
MGLDPGAARLPWRRATTGISAATGNKANANHPLHAATGPEHSSVAARARVIPC